MDVGEVIFGRAVSAVMEVCADGAFEAPEGFALAAPVPKVVLAPKAMKPKQFAAADGCRRGPSRLRLGVCWFGRRR